MKVKEQEVAEVHLEVHLERLAVRLVPPQPLRLAALEL